MSGKCPISKRLLKILYNGNEIGVAMIAKNFPGIPQWEEFDFLMSLHNLATSIGEVLICPNFSKMSSLGGSSGAGSSAPSTVAFSAKNSLKILLFLSGSVTTSSLSIIGGMWETLLFFINLLKIENFFFAGIFLLCIVELTVLKKACLARLLALVDSLLAVLDLFSALSNLCNILVTISGDKFPLPTALSCCILIFLKKA